MIVYGRFLFRLLGIFCKGQIGIFGTDNNSFFLFLHCFEEKLPFQFSENTLLFTNASFDIGHQDQQKVEMCLGSLAHFLLFSNAFFSTCQRRNKVKKTDEKDVSCQHLFTGNVFGLSALPKKRGKLPREEIKDNQNVSSSLLKMSAFFLLAAQRLATVIATQIR